LQAARENRKKEKSAASRGEQADAERREHHNRSAAYSPVEVQMSAGPNVSIDLERQRYTPEKTTDIA
jgi:hypothetical protein